MTSTGTRTKVRPQQSCLKCRERKVKCDRNIPCEACVNRGIESECTYLTSAEDRAQISQAEIIERLRREVAQLRDELSQSSGRSPSPIHRDRVYADRKKAPGVRERFGVGHDSMNTISRARGPGSRSATGSAEPTDLASCADSASPSSLSTTTGTSSVTVTSPESTGSEGGANGSGFFPQYAYPGVVDGYPTQMADVEMMATADSAAMNHYYGDESTIQYLSKDMPSYSSKDPEHVTVHHHPMQTMYSTFNDQVLERTPSGVHPNQQVQVHGRHHYDPASSHTYEYTSYQTQPGFQNPPSHDFTTSNSLPSYGVPEFGNHQAWTDDPGHIPVSSQRIPSPRAPFQHPSTLSAGGLAALPSTTTPVHLASTSTSTSTPYHLHAHGTPYHLSQPYIYPAHATEYQTRAMDAIPESWKGPDKQPLLEALLETITSCDEQRVAQVVAVIRASSTPEDAVSGICRILGISGDWT
ncbi:Fungal Zn(2)-Cys(6) binuclear cluster domain-containing protein [Penicillium ucsense]|uniref:Fungal Zn(2)-Cys(6) binuclear cluster domain-containing protein n=1 Tax=Penicillium ucsense TaxID=2839758 RepID=A0A8J8W0V7_9EURO|nr:Fungal Zn(2)-Cys(6) binuclear cluster domain-containing protein [Penicillium ucsense]KAF7738062.1 Fungal Zn(2)-Cys(6) binuclear cluster domain-containing protein [Penicillium ucsense]